MAGLAPISLQQRCGVDGRPYPNARAYFYEADTLTPIDTYKDYGLGTPHPNPVQADAYGVFPAIFIDEAEQFYRMRITTSSGVMLTDLTTLPVIGPSGGGGGSEVPVDPDALFKTGFPLWLPKSGTQSGFVRLNARTIGSASSGAAERANADCEALFLYMWQTYSNTFCPVSGGRGVSAAADWSANKTLQLLDMRNKGPFGLDDMGNSAASGFSGITFGGGDATTPGSYGGGAMHTLTEAQLPSHVHAQTAQQPSFTYTTAESQSGSGANRVNVIQTSGGVSTVTTNDDASPGNTGSVGSNSAHNNMPPFMLGTWYVKL
jgi:microcystin-dependent protein